MELVGKVDPILCNRFKISSGHVGCSIEGQSLLKERKTIHPSLPARKVIMRSSGRKLVGALTLASHGCWSGRKWLAVDIIAHMAGAVHIGISLAELAMRVQGCIKARICMDLYFDLSCYSLVCSDDPVCGFAVF